MHIWKIHLKVFVVEVCACAYNQKCYGDTLSMGVLQKNAEIMFLLLTLKLVKHLSNMQQKKTQKMSRIVIVSELWVDISKTNSSVLSKLKIRARCSRIFRLD